MIVLRRFVGKSAVSPDMDASLSVCARSACAREACSSSHFGCGGTSLERHDTTKAGKNALFFFVSVRQRVALETLPESH